MGKLEEGGKSANFTGSWTASWVTAQHQYQQFCWTLVPPTAAVSLKTFREMTVLKEEKRSKQIVIKYHNNVILMSYIHSLFVNRWR